MALRWRLVLVVIAAAAVVGGVMPHGALAGAGRTTTQVLQVAESPLWEPVHCADATCGKGNATPAVPTPALMLAGVVGGLVAAAIVVASVRRRRTHVAALALGWRDPLYHPPQFS